MKVLDIGAGTGVQAIVAWKTLQNLCKVKGGELNVKVGQVVAIEGVGLAFKNLKENCKDKNQITIHNAALIAKTNKSNGQHREGIGARMITQEEVKQLKQGLEQYWVEKGYTVLEEKEEIVDGFLRADSSAEELQLACDFDVVIADLPFVDALPEVHALPEDDPERAFYDMNHREHRTLFAAVKTRWLKKDGLLITSFSGLGGLEDVRRFERLARDMGFQAVQRFDFYEQGHVWMVYAFMRKDDRKEPENWDKGQDDFWLNRLGVKKRT